MLAVLPERVEVVRLRPGCTARSQPGTAEVSSGPPSLRGRIAGLARDTAFRHRGQVDLRYAFAVGLAVSAAASSGFLLGTRLLETACVAQREPARPSGPAGCLSTLTVLQRWILLLTRVAGLTARALGRR